MKLVTLLVSLAVAALLVAWIAPAAAGANYTVSTNPYTANRTLVQSDPWDTHELVAQTGQTVAYAMSVSTTGGCLSLLFVKGHNANVNSQYFVAYSQENCVTSYSNSFPVASADGTQFTVLLATTQTQDVAYTVTISISAPAIPSWVLGLLIVIVIAVVPTVVVFLWRRRKRARMPPMAPPPYTGAPGAPMAPPTQPPPVQPPQEPWQPPPRP